MNLAALVAYMAEASRSVRGKRDRLYKVEDEACLVPTQASLLSPLPEVGEGTGVG